jgi:hypothetical protein
MRYLAKRKRAERAHRYRVLAQQLDFHLSTDSMGPEADGLIQQAKQALLEAAAVLERVDDSAQRTATASQRG